jgi:hypothetical protein
VNKHTAIVQGCFWKKRKNGKEYKYPAAQIVVGGKDLIPLIGKRVLVSIKAAKE